MEREGSLANLGSGIMSGTAVDLKSFQKLGFGDPNL